MDSPINLSKFNSFDLVLETAFGHFNNSGFREGTPLFIKKAFLSSEYFKKHYSGHADFSEWIKGEIERGALFFIHRVSTGVAGQNVKDSNSNNGLDNVYLELKSDPRVVRWPTEWGKFVVPGDFKYVDIWSDPVNLPPLDAVRKDYSAEKAAEYKNDNSLNNRPKDSVLPVKNTKLPHSNKWKDSNPGAR